MFVLLIYLKRTALRHAHVITFIKFFQVSTATGIVTHYYNVTVIVPTTTIVGGSEYHVDKGSAIQLTCVIHNVSNLATHWQMAMCKY